MDDPRARRVTELLGALRLGDVDAAEALYSAVYDELRARAAGYVDPRRTLHPTALVHEAWLKLDGKLAGVRDRTHFLALSALVMRQVLTDHARAEGARKRSAERATVSLSRLGEEEGPDPIDLVALDQALAKLEGLQARHARVVELRFLAGLTIAETAEVLGVSHTTVESDWAMARAWLRSELDGAG